MLEEITPPEVRERLEREHLAAHSGKRAFSGRQRLRLYGLRTVGALLRSLPHRRDGPARRILVIRPDHLGDLLFTTPALSRLRQRHPDAHITAMVGPWGRPVLAHNPDIDDVIICPFPGFTRRPKTSVWEPYRILLDCARSLRSYRFDEAIIFRFDHWWGAWLAALSGIPSRVGYDVAETRPFLTRSMPEPPDRHEVARALTLVDPRLSDVTPERYPLRFVPSAGDEAWADELLRSMGPSAPVIVIHPGAGVPVKLWRSSAWARVADAVIERHRASVVITGGASERALAEQVTRSMRHAAVVLTGQTTLGQLGALFKRCALVLGPDSGPLHLAVAVGTPTVHLFGPADPRRFGPWGDPLRHRVLTSEWACAPCNRLDYPEAELPKHGCVRDIPEAQVIEAAFQLLA
ncbi:MAG: glycosyltransferase family 9 protein [Anaerolineae bacterium]|nr:glycosyltransferase family 9 protein [Anaerolineae bacterium]